MAKRRNKGVGLEKKGQSHLKGINYLLAVAINEYEHHPTLSNCVRDATDLVRVLQKKYGFAPEHTITLFDKQATAANLYMNLVKLSEIVTSKDNLLVYFSGHGFFDRSDKTGHLVPVEASKGAVWQYFSNANFVNRIRAINSLHTFLVVDSCFSGSLFATKEGSRTTTQLAERVEGLSSRWALAAGQIEVVDDGLHGDHSPFAMALLSFLNANENPMVPVSELIQHVKLVTPHNARQTPVGGVLFNTGDVGGEFVFHLIEKGFPLETTRTKTRYETEEILLPTSQKSTIWSFFKRLRYIVPVGLSLLLLLAIFLKIYTPENPSAQNEQTNENVFLSTASQVTEKAGMRFIEGGEFNMGDTFGDGFPNENTVHSVIVGDFYMGIYDGPFA